ncbi:hypothetical protein ACO0K7_11455 [Undibacterium sp. Ji67W]|uniref:hypothetical protein n=1 Tax=Undibacterium sp. Ji67W TaxID=3413042 RepID=UPI003BF3C2E4
MLSIPMLIGKLAPAYIYVFAGYLCKRLTMLKERVVANCLFYIFIPVTVFKGALSSDAGHFFDTDFVGFGDELYFGRDGLLFETSIF